MKSLPVTVHDISGEEDKYPIDTYGFQFVKHESKEKSFHDAEKIKAELARTEEMQREALHKASEQATKLIEQARAAAARVQEQETQKAIAAAEQIIAKAREATGIEREKIMTELKREVGRLVIDTTARVTGRVPAAC